MEFADIFDLGFNHVTKVGGAIFGGVYLIVIMWLRFGERQIGTGTLAWLAAFGLINYILFYRTLSFSELDDTRTILSIVVMLIAMIFFMTIANKVSIHRRADTVRSFLRVHLLFLLSIALIVLSSHVI